MFDLRSYFHKIAVVLFSRIKLWKSVSSSGGTGNDYKCVSASNTCMQWKYCCSCAATLHLASDTNSGTGTGRGWPHNVRYGLCGGEKGKEILAPFLPSLGICYILKLITTYDPYISSWFSCRLLSFCEKQSNPDADPECSEEEMLSLFSKNLKEEYLKKPVSFILVFSPGVVVWCQIVFDFFNLLFRAC